MIEQNVQELPRYKSHKEVHALKIKHVERLKPTIEQLDAILNRNENPPAGMIIPEDMRYGPISVSDEYMQKHNPQAGGYYVVYENGYKSWSPAKAFEEGYTLIA